MSKLLPIIALVGIMTIISCARFPGGVAPSNVPLYGKEYTILQKTRASDSTVYLFSLIPVSGSNSIRKAMQAAINKAGGDALINITAERYYQNWILFSRDVITVEGTAIRFSD